MTPVEVVVGPPPTPEPDRQQDPELLIAQHEGMASQNDEVPLPVPAVVQAGAEGDETVTPASGDPYFLGFTGGLHYPPANELIDPLILERYQPGMDLRPGDFTYAFVMFSKRMTPARLARLEALGCRLLKFHPHYTVKVALTPAILTDVSVLPFVRWVGQATDRQKYHPGLSKELAQTDEVRLNVIVNLFESDLNDASVGTLLGSPYLVQPGSPPYLQENQGREDEGPRLWMSNGWMQQRLESLGLEVQWYSPRSMSIQGWIGREQLDSLASLDFVQDLEIVPEHSTTALPHDESMAMITTDRIRNTYPGDTNQVAIVGVQDSGIETDHTDLNIMGVGWNCTAGASAWDDDAGATNTGHGTHVTGTVLGRGVTRTDLLGVAPGLASWGGTSRLFNLRRYADAGNCTWSIDACIDVFQSAYTDGGGSTTAKPHLITNSWGYTSIPFSGTEAHARSLDTAVYGDDQLWIFSAGNSGPGASTIGGGGSAKNILTVGNVVDYIDAGVGDPGNAWTSSSRGPMTDGRWKPNLAAPGRWIQSALANNNTGYTDKSGTSMAAPHVAGVAATLVDHLSYTRYNPAVTSAMLMATAITKNDQTLASPGGTHHNTYGAGRVSSYKAHWTTSGYAYLGIYTFTQTNAVWSYADFTVPIGTTRLVAVMHYVEEQCSSGASQALVHDYDLWLDRDPVDTANGNTGEYWAQQSQVDNTEIRIINSPQSGAWRWKTYPDSAGATLVKMAVVIYAIYDDTTPDATFTLGVDDSTIQPGNLVTVSATVDPTDYIASAVILDRSGSASTMLSSSTTLYDGLVTDLTDSFSGGTDILLGDTLDFAPRTATWGLSYSTEGAKSVTVQARSDNMVDKTATVNLIVDGTQPGVVSNLTSPTHSPGVWSNNPNVTWTWSAATDALSGIQGYGIYETVYCASPGAILDIGAVTSYTGGPYSSASSGRAFNIRSVDNADNWDSDYVCDSNYLIDVDAPAAPTFSSSDHAVNGKSCNSTITVTWNAVSDPHSGVAGYGLYWSTNATSCPAQVMDTTGTSDTVSLSPGTWYLHVITKDNAGNWTACPTAAHFGPFTIVSSCTLFSDDFESGGYGAGGWAISSAGRCKVKTGAAYTGTYGARLKKGGRGTGPCTVGTLQTWIQAPPVDTTGWSGVRVDMNAHFRKNTLSCEFMDLQYWDGFAWQSIGIVENHPWGPYSFNLPAGAMGNPALSLRLITNSKGKGERAELDDFVVTGIE